MKTKLGNDSNSQINYSKAEEEQLGERIPFRLEPVRVSPKNKWLIKVN